MQVALMMGAGVYRASGLNAMREQYGGVPPQRRGE